MAYKTILSVLTDPALIQAPLDHAIAIANSQDSHLDALCLGVDRTQTGYYYAGANAMILQETLTRAHAEATELKEMVSKILTLSGVRWSCEDGVAQLPDLARHVSRHAFLSDLVVLPLPYGENRGAEVEAVVEAAMFDGHTPVLVIPDGAEAKGQPDTILVAWNESPESRRAVVAALPFLQGAKMVRIVVIDPPVHGPTRSDPGGPLSQMLSRHGVTCEIDVLGRTLPRVSDVLNRHVTDCDADMVVMGAYGHSRFREAILGGATRNMLEQSKVPVFMAH